MRDLLVLHTMAGAPAVYAFTHTSSVASTTTIIVAAQHQTATSLFQSVVRDFHNKRTAINALAIVAISIVLAADGFVLAPSSSSSAPTSASVAEPSEVVAPPTVVVSVVVGPAVVGAVV